MIYRPLTVFLLYFQINFYENIPHIFFSQQSVTLIPQMLYFIIKYKSWPRSKKSQDLERYIKTISYTLPARDLGCITARYKKQCQTIKRAHDKAKDYANYSEHFSGLQKFISLDKNGLVILNCRHDSSEFSHPANYVGRIKGISPLIHRIKKTEAPSIQAYP